MNEGVTGYTFNFRVVLIETTICLYRNEHRTRNEADVGDRTRQSIL